MKISIIGSGFVGEILGRGLMGLGYTVIFHDIVDKDLPNFTKNINYAMNSDISFICVPTPTEGEEGIDLGYIKDAAEGIGKALSEKNAYHVVVVKSTVVPKTTEDIVIPLLEKYSEKKAGEDFGICINPEFLTEISGTWSSDKDYNKDFFTEDRIVIGEYDKRSGDVLEGV